MFAKLLWVAVIGIAAWLFGNLYEAIVFMPNALVADFQHFRFVTRFFALTSPPHYFVPFTFPAMILTPVLAWRARADQRLAANMRRGALALLLATLVNLVAVRHYSLVLWFGDGDYSTPMYRTLMGQWTVLNLLRICFTAFSLYCLLRAATTLSHSPAKPPT